VAKAQRRHQGRFAPASPPTCGGSARSLVVFAHGYGADRNDLIDIGRGFYRMRRLQVHTPPSHASAHLTGWQSFPLTPTRSNQVLARRICSGSLLDCFFDTEFARWKLDPQRLVLVRFSQGTMMALHVGLRLRAGPAAIDGRFLVDAFGG
jgi:phospholipase/carboxylesterase